MSSRLLRRLLVSQIVTGILLGWFIARQTHASLWLVVLFALLMPSVLTAMMTLILAIKSRTPGAHALWLRSLGGECVAAIRMMTFKMPWSFSPPVVKRPTASPSSSPAPLPVVLVHGYLCNHRIWDAMSDSLLRAGHPVLGVDLEPLFTSIDDYAPLIEQAVTELCRQTGASQVALVGHSMGGLAIRAWLRAYGSNRVDRIITLGTPHVGTRVDLHPKTANGQQMLWHSTWLQELTASETAATRSLMRLALSPQDSIVYPQREQVLEGVPVTVFDGLGHLELCLDPAVIAWTVQELELKR
ncbi:MAG: alpha/beta fold hydrolase [Pseudomonadota bacterium]